MVVVTSWIVYEVETGFKDGMYARKSMAEKALTSWHGQRPEYKHILIDEYNRAITDNEWLGIQHHLPKGNKRVNL